MQPEEKTRAKKREWGRGSKRAWRAIISTWLTIRHQTGPTSLIGMLCNAATKMSWPWEGALRSPLTRPNTHTHIHKCVCSQPKINPMVISENMEVKPMKSDRLQPLETHMRTQTPRISKEKHQGLLGWSNKWCTLRLCVFLTWCYWFPTSKNMKANKEDKNIY